MAAFAFIATFKGADGTDIQLIAAGIFSTVFAVAIGCEGIIARLEEIRDKDKPKPPPTEYVA
jgi:hypothetical protein